MSKQSGFTLIELVVIIVILGILSVVAAPRFLNLQRDARISTLQGIKAAVIDANHIIYSKTAILNEEKSDSLNTPEVPDDVGRTKIVYGNMSAQGGSFTYYVNLEDFTGDINIDGPAGQPAIRIQMNDYGTRECYIEYYEAYKDDATDQIVQAEVAVFDEGC